MSSYVKRVQAKGIYGRFDIDHTFKPGVNVLHGKNGAGKTTLLHILANVLNGDYELFAFITFDSIRVQLDDSTEVMLHRRGADKDTIINIQRTGYPEIELSVEDFKEYVLRRREGVRVQQLSIFDDEFNKLSQTEPLMKTAYFPAFRTMIEAWASVQEDRTVASANARRARELRELMETEVYRVERSALMHGGTLRATQFARQLFGPFVPSITYPSPLEIEVRLTEEFRKAERNIGYANQKLLSEAFLDIFSVLSETSGQVEENPEAILERIRALFNELDTSSLGAASMVDEDFYSKLRNKVNDFKFYSENLEGVAVRVLEVYRNSLSNRANIQKSSFLGIRQYLQAVNEFLEGKILCISQQPPELNTSSLQVKFDNGSYSSLRALSSGERQIITLIYAASQMSAQKIVLIDEPEISLHIDWQRPLLKKMSEQLQDRQIIACTHSPVIASNYEDRLMELKLIPSSNELHKDTLNNDYHEAESEDEDLF